MREHTGTSIAIAAVTTIAYTIWAGVIAIVLWLCLTVYAIVKWIGAPADHASPRTVLLLMAGTVSLYVVLVALAIYAIGRPMHDKKRKRRDAEQLALAFGDDA